MAIRGQASSALRQGEEYEEVQIGRGAVFGNMFAMRKDGSDRNAVCDGYEELLHDLEHADVHAIGRRRGVNLAVREDGEIMKYTWRGQTHGYDDAEHGQRLRTALQELASDMRRGKRVRLMCSCAPERCHGDSIARHVWRGLEAEDAAAGAHAEAAAEAGRSGEASSSGAATVAGASAEARAETAAPTGGEQIEVGDRRAGKQGARGKRSREGAEIREESRKAWRKAMSKAKKRKKAAEAGGAATARGEQPAWRSET